MMKDKRLRTPDNHKKKKGFNKKTPARKVTPTEADLWRRVMVDVDPIKDTAPLYVPVLEDMKEHGPLSPDIYPTDVGGINGQKSAVRVYRPESSPGPSSSRTLPRLDHGVQPGLDRATAQKMRRGRIRPQRTVDLHGLTQDEARRALSAFLSAAQQTGCRDVLVITGKGVKKDGSIGVLREKTPQWLNEGHNRERIVAFSYAAPKDGGHGALYVRLKKRSPR